MSSSRPFITTHVLNTTTGKPGAGIAVILTLISPRPVPSTRTTPTTTPTAAEWTATTNSDGRVVSWQSSPQTTTPTPPTTTTTTTTTTSTTNPTAVDGNDDLNQTIQEVQAASADADGEIVWSLQFATEAYFGRGQTFWPEVELRFATQKDEGHYHVPLLLGPWSYTTYRGS